MFERFTERAKRIVALSQDEARRLSHHYIGTEHILLALIQEGEGIAAQALVSMDISLDAARERVQGVIGEGVAAQMPAGHIPFTPRSKKVLELSLREALQLGHNYICTEHILLGLIREGEGVAAQVLIEMGAELSTVRSRVIRILSDGGSPIKVARPNAEQRRSAYFEAQLGHIRQQLFRLDSDIQAVESVRSGLEIMDAKKALDGSHQMTNFASMLSESEKHLSVLDIERSLVQDVHDRTRLLVEQLQ